ncbi:LexA family transcriptional regulator [Halomonas sp. BN3-1]|uniref:XRE family transcriptional regulator n=1 Tax=Halomonas sp. BN3-1 TaxID=2082393 RepID=UPI000D36C672|nr:LexA family transcriptional regulator [Halomonas sp. BN3-1]
MTIGERLKEERERLALSQTALAAIGGVGKTTQINYEKGLRNPDSAYLTAVAEQGVDLLYVLKGSRSVDSSSGGEVNAFDGGSHNDTLLMGGELCPINLYDIEAAAGDGRSLEAEEVETTIYFPGEQLAAQGLDPAHVVGVKVRGDSMEDTLADGDWVLVDRKDRPDRPEGVFLLLVEGERRIKRVQRVAGGAWVLISDNSHYQAEMIPPEKLGNVAVLGRCVVRIGRIS